jgi:hypothetical protein
LCIFELVEQSIKVKSLSSGNDIPPTIFCQGPITPRYSPGGNAYKQTIGRAAPSNVTITIGLTPYPEKQGQHIEKKGTIRPHGAAHS